MKKPIEIITRKLTKELRKSKKEATKAGELESNMFLEQKQKYLSQLNISNDDTVNKNQLEYNRFITEKEIELVKNDSSDNRNVALLSIVVAFFALALDIFDKMGTNIYFQAIYIVVVCLLFLLAFYSLIRDGRVRKKNYLYLEFKLKCIDEELQKINNKKTE